MAEAPNLIPLTWLIPNTSFAINFYRWSWSMHSNNNIMLVLPVCEMLLIFLFKDRITF